MHQLINKYKKKKIVMAFATFILILLLFFLYLGIKTPAAIPHGQTTLSFPQRISRGFSNLQESVGFKQKSAQISPMPESPSQGLKTKQATFTAKQIADATVSYLDKQRRPDGFYDFVAHFQDTCKNPTDPSSCLFGANNSFEEANMWTMLGYLGYYQNFDKNPQNLSKAVADADSLAAHCREKSNLCLATLTQFSELYKETKNEAYKELLSQLGNLLLNETKTSEMMTLGIHAREFAQLYEIWGDPRFLEASQQRIKTMQAASNKFVEKNGKDNDACYLIAAKYEVSKATNDTDTKQEIKKFFLENREETVSTQMTFIQPCIETAIHFGRDTHDDFMTKTGDALLTKYVQERWDGPGLQRKYQEGGFLMDKERSIVNVTDTGYMLYILSLRPEKTYAF